MTELTDISPMPFGKYKGEPMQDIPANYLHYLWNAGMKNKVETDSVAEYIRRSLSALKLENPDKIW